MLHLLLTGGGSGGHTYPLLAVARAIRKKEGPANVNIVYVGPKSKMADREREEFAKESIPAFFVSAGKVRRYAAKENFTDPFLTFWGICQSLVLLLRQMPDVVFAKGGYGAVPVVIAARLYGIPVLIHESDAVAGMANRLLGKISSRIALAYPHAERYFSSRKTAVVGIPIREEILRGDKERARKRYRLRDDLPTVLVLGGSQGARALNEATVSALPKLLARTQVIHQTGTENYRAVVAAAAKEGIKAGRDRYFPTSFLSAEEMGDALALADIVISRAGAGAIAEIAACQKAAILVPLDISANDHQRMNAYEVAKIGGALVLEEANLGAPMLAGKIFEILDDVRLKTSMEKNISVFFNPRAAEVIADGLSELVSD